MSTSITSLNTDTSSTLHFDGKMAVGDYDPFMSLDSALPGPQVTSQALPVPYSKDPKPSTAQQEPTFLPSPSYLPPPPLPPASDSTDPLWYHGSQNTETTVPEEELDSSFNNTSVEVNESSSNVGLDPAWYHGEDTLTSLKDGIVSSPTSLFGSRIQKRENDRQKDTNIVRDQNDSGPDDTNIIREQNDSGSDDTNIIREQNDSGSDIRIREVSSRVEHVPKRRSVIMRDEPTVTITSVTIKKMSDDGNVSKTKVIENGERLDGGKFDGEIWEQDSQRWSLSPVDRRETVKTEVISEQKDQAYDNEEKSRRSSMKIVKDAEEEQVSSKRGSRKVVESKKEEKDSDDSVEESEEEEEEKGKKKKEVVKSKEMQKKDGDGGKKVVKKTEKKKTQDSDNDSDDSSELSSDSDDSDDSEISSDSDDSDDSEEKTKRKKKVVKEGAGAEKAKVEKKKTTGTKKTAEGDAKKTEKKETSATKKPAGSDDNTSSMPKKDYPPLTDSDDSSSDNEGKGKREKIKEKVKECIIA